MKLRMILAMVLALVLLCGCTPAADPTAPSTAAPTVTPTATPTTAPTAAPVITPTEPVAPTEPTTNVNNPFTWGYFDQIIVHPFSQTELTAVLDLLSTKLAATADKEDVVSYTTHWISFDPYGTLVSIKDQIQNAPVEGWTEADYYTHKAVFVVCFSLDVDETKSTGTDYTEQLGTVTLTRETIDGEWTIDVAACSAEPICEPSSMVIPPEVIKNVHRSEEFALAGYHDEAVGEYLIYVLDEDNNTVLCWSYYAAKPN